MSSSLDSEIFKNSLNGPDVLETIANLSNDEIFTPPKLANKILDILPNDLWNNPDLKFIDPFCKTGIFLREITKRLMIGLVESFPDQDKRREHILKNMVYGIGITELTSLMSRRSLYCASDATRKKDEKFPEKCYSAVLFENKEGNILFPESKHEFDKDNLCKHCGLKNENSKEKETYAYPFLHMSLEELIEMKFDVVIGNPPYQMKDGGHGASARPMYHLFVENAKKLNPKYISMIIPARWYSGGKGLDEFRDTMINDRRLSKIVDFPDSKECFPGQDIKGGICYFLWDRDHQDDCEFTTIIKNNIESMKKRDLRTGGKSLIRDNLGAVILEKIQNKTKYKSFSSIVSSRKPFDLSTSYLGNIEKKFDDDILVYRNKISGQNYGYIRKNDIKKNNNWVNLYKVLVPKASDGKGGKLLDVLGKPILAKPNEICTETYLVIGPFSNEITAKNVESYIKTKFFRFLVLLIKPTQDNTKDKFEHVPIIDFSKIWTDQELYKHFSLTEEEILHIEEAIKEMK